MLVKIVDSDYILRAIKCGFDVRQASGLFTLENRVYYFDQRLERLLPEVPRGAYFGDHCIVLDLDQMDKLAVGDLLDSLRCLKITYKTYGISQEVDYENRTDEVGD